MVLGQQWESTENVESAPESVLEGLRVTRDFLKDYVLSLDDLQRQCSKARAFVAQQAIEELRQRLEDITTDISAIIGDNLDPERSDAERLSDDSWEGGSRSDAGI